MNTRSQALITRALMANALVVALLAAGCSSSGTTSRATAPTAEGEDTVTLVEGQEATAQCPTEGEEWEVAKLYIEHNATDADTGVHGLFGGEAWSVMCIWDPDGNEVLVADPLDRLDDLTVADLFFESREPANDEVAIDRILADFPEGEYLVGGIDYEGTARATTAVFSHAIPAEPQITSPPLVTDPEEDEPPVIDTTGLVVRWEPVTETIEGEPVEITAYEVIVTLDDWDDPNGLSRPVYDVHVGPDVTELAVPDGWLIPGTLYEVEVLALEATGNQTIGLGFFTT